MNGVAIDSEETFEINTVAGAGEKTGWTGTASIRFNVADAQRPLASASEVVQTGNRIAMEADGGLIQSVATGEKIKPPSGTRSICFRREV